MVVQTTEPVTKPPHGCRRRSSSVGGNTLPTQPTCQAVFWGQVEPLITLDVSSRWARNREIRSSLTYASTIADQPVAIVAPDLLSKYPVCSSKSTFSMGTDCQGAGCLR